MGLDFRGSEAHWAYSGFNNFRVRLAASIGMNLDLMEGFVSNGQSWEKWKDDPICILLDHSDCDGSISAEDCGKCGPRLEEIVNQWKASASKRLDYDIEHGLMLARDMIALSKTNENLEFC